MNIFYTPPSQIHGGYIKLIDQEAKHASKVMRVREGDKLTVVDGQGSRYQGMVKLITDDTVQAEISDIEKVAEASPQLILGMGIIKKRDRLEFAVEKAIELGVSGIGLFRSERTIKENVRMDRLESIAISAMKQSLRTWLPEITLFDSPFDLLETYADTTPLIAHEKVNQQDQQIDIENLDDDQLLLMVGPEGGFTPSEVHEFRERGAHLVSLGANRLRTETAVVAFMSQFLLSE